MAEFRIRNVSPELQKQLKALEQHFKENNATDAVVRLINAYPGYLKEIAEQRRAIYELSDKLRVYTSKEGTVKDQLRNFLTQLKYQVKHTETFIRQYGTKKGSRPRSRKPVKVASKKVPKKAGKK